MQDHLHAWMARWMQVTFGHLICALNQHWVYLNDNHSSEEASFAYTGCLLSPKYLASSSSSVIRCSNQCTAQSFTGIPFLCWLYSNLHFLRQFISFSSVCLISSAFVQSSKAANKLFLKPSNTGLLILDRVAREVYAASVGSSLWGDLNRGLEQTPNENLKHLEWENTHNRPKQCHADHAYHGSLAASWNGFLLDLQCMLAKMHLLSSRDSYSLLPGLGWEHLYVDNLKSAQ